MPLWTSPPEKKNIKWMSNHHTQKNKQINKNKLVVKYLIWFMNITIWKMGGTPKRKEKSAVLEPPGDVPAIMNWRRMDRSGARLPNWRRIGYAGDLLWRPFVPHGMQGSKSSKSIWKKNIKWMSIHPKHIRFKEH